MADIDPLVQSMLPYAPTTAYPAVRRSQYLADALQNINSSAQNNLRTPASLWSNLAAEALLQSSRKKNNKDLQTQLQGGQQAVAQQLLGGLPGGGQPAPASPMAAGLGAPPPVSAAPMPPLGAGTPPPPQGGGGPPMPAPQPQMSPGGAPGPQQPLPQPMPQRPQQGQQGPPTQPINPAEVAQVKQWLASPYPYLRQLGMQKAAELNARSMQYVPLKPGETYGPDGQAQYVGAKTQSIPGQTPADAAQIGPDGTITHAAIPSMMGRPEPNDVWNGHGYTKMPTTVAGGASYPLGAPKPDEPIKIAQDTQNAPPVFAYNNLRSKIGNIMSPGFKEGPAKDIARVDAIVEAFGGNPTQKPTEGFFNKVEDSQGWIRGSLAKMYNETHVNGGILSPGLRGNLENALQNTLAERKEAADIYLQQVRPSMEIGYPGQSQTLAPNTAAIPPGAALPPDAGVAGGPGIGAAPASRPPTQPEVQLLRQHPDLRGEFDRKFGPGASAHVLGR